MDQFDIPIPLMAEFRLRRDGARSFPIQLESRENGEQAFNALAFGIRGENYYYKVAHNPPYFHQAPGSIAELYVREGVLKKLQKVNDTLFSYGLEVFLFDAYRPIEVQNYFHDIWVPKYLREQHPDWSDEKIRSETGKYWAQGASSMDDIDPLSPPPHATGGVVDLTLRSLDTKEHLYMGSQFDEVDEVSFTDHFEKLEKVRALTQSEKEAQKNRRLLYWVMHEAKMVVNPNEWWHFGYGDQLSAKVSGAPHAVYSVLRVE